MTGKPFSAAEAQQLGLVDIVVQTSANAYSEVEATINRLKSSQSQLLHTCKTVFPMMSVEEALVTMGAHAMKGWTNEVELEENLVLTDFGEAEGSAVLTLNNPKHHNVLDLAMAHAFENAIQSIQEHIDQGDDIRAVILVGAGDDFSAARADTEDSTTAGPKRHQINMKISGLASLGVPVLAVLHGRVQDRGLDLALKADWRVCTEGTKLSVSAHGGTPLASALHKLQSIGGVSVATSLYFENKGLDAASASEHGLVSQVFQDVAAANAHALALADNVAHSPRDGVKRCLTLFRAPDDNGWIKEDSAQLLEDAYGSRVNSKALEEQNGKGRQMASSIGVSELQIGAKLTSASLSTATDAIKPHTAALFKLEEGINAAEERTHRE